MLPMPVLERAASELVCYGESGMSVMEMSHRSPDYEAIIQAAEAESQVVLDIDSASKATPESIRYATMVVTIGPIILLYPFLQKYFEKGVLIGSVKG